MKYKIRTDLVLDLVKCKLYRIEALKDFSDIKKGDLGGYVESESNLSQEGNCWIYDNASARGCSIVSGNAIIFDDAQVYGNARVCEEAGVSEARISGNAIVSGYASVYGIMNINNNMNIKDRESLIHITGPKQLNVVVTLSGINIDSTHFENFKKFDDDFETFASYNGYDDAETISINKIVESSISLLNTYKIIGE